MIELAECQRRMGRIEAAEHSLERATRFPSVRTEAERALSRIRMEYRAPQLAPSSAAEH